MAVLRNPFSRRTYSALLEAEEEDRIPKHIVDKLDLIDKKIDNIYQDIYISRPSDSATLDDTLDKLNSALDRLQTDEMSVGGMTQLIQRIDAKSGNTNVERMVGSIKDLFSDENLVNHIFANQEIHKFIAAQNRQFDTLCKYIPKLQDALEIKRDNVLCSDNFAKNYINPKSNKASKKEAELFAANSKRLEKEYEFSDFVDDTYMNCSKYGEDFIYIVPYRTAFDRLVKRAQQRQSDPVLGAYGFYENTNYNQFDMEPIVESGYLESEDFRQYKGVVTEYAGKEIFRDFDDKFKGLEVNLYSNTSGMLQEAVNEHAVLHSMKDYTKFKSLFTMHEKTVTADLNIEDEKLRHDGITKAANSKDGLILNNDLNIEPEKISEDILGAVMERLPRENVIPVYIGKKCVGYYYLEFAENPNACGFCGGTHGAMPGYSNASRHAYEMTEDQQELALRYISARMSSQIDTKFINKNKDLKEEIYAILRYNEKFDIQRSNNIGVTFIPAEDIVHCYFKLDENTHRGISDLEKAIVPGMLYILLYLTDIIGKITRSTDKRVYYVKQNVEQNIARTMMNTVAQIKKGNFGMRQLESMNSMLNIVGQYNDYIIPVGPSGDPPIQFEVMSGQNIETPSEIMEKMEESAINTIMPIELVNSTMQVDYASRYSMSNARFMKDLYTRQKKTQIWVSKLYTRVYNYEYGENNRYIETILPPPVYLTMTNNSQLIDSVTQIVDKIVELDLADKSDEIKAEFKKLYVRDYLSTYFDQDQIDKYIGLAEVNVETNKTAAADDGEEDMGEYL